MGDTRFRIWFGDRAASEDALSRVESIEVVQEMDQIWHADIRIAMCLDADGTWLHWPGDDSAHFSRVRVEIDLGDGHFEPLIDGPLAGIDADLDSQPGRSTATMQVRDDSAFMNRDEDTEAPFEHRAMSTIAEQLFGRFPQIRDKRIQTTSAEPETTTRRGTVLQFLRERGKQVDRHAYVLPGSTPGASIGCFLPDPEGAADLPPLRMIGDDRNLADARISEQPDGAERTVARVLRVSDQGVTTFETSAQDLGLMRDLPAVPADLTPRRLLAPEHNTAEDPEAAARAQARRRGYVYTLRGEVVPGCYAAVLTPYRKVRVEAGRTSFSGDYLLTRVVHRITPSLYAQSIEGKADSVTRVPGSSIADALGGGLSVSASAGAGLF